MAASIGQGYPGVEPVLRRGRSRLIAASSIARFHNGDRAARWRAGAAPRQSSVEHIRYVVLRQVVSKMDPEAGSELAGDIDRFYGMITSLKSDRVQVAALATSTADLAGRLVPRLTDATYDQPRTLRLMKLILNSADYITRQGERPAKQAAMAVQSLYTAYSAKGKPAN